MRRSRDEDFREVSWEEALEFTVAEIRRIQQTYGNDAFGLLGGASLFSEKTYLVGKFARVALKTRHVDYNGRLCMVSAAGANKLAFNIDRAGNPFSDILLTDCLLIAGSNVGECFPRHDAVRVGRPGPGGRQPHRDRPPARRQSPGPPTSTSP